MPENKKPRKPLTEEQRKRKADYQREYMRKYRQRRSYRKYQRKYQRDYMQRVRASRKEHNEGD